MSSQQISYVAVSNKLRIFNGDSTLKALFLDDYQDPENPCDKCGGPSFKTIMSMNYRNA